MNDLLYTRLNTELFNNKDSAEKAYDKALSAGYTPEDITILLSEDSKKKYFDSVLIKKSNKASEGLGVGGAIGAAVLGLSAALAALGTNLVIPGLGMIVAGPLAAGLAGAGAGSVTGGLIGALIGWGIPENQAQLYESGLHSGGIVLGVNDHLPNNQMDWQGVFIETKKSLLKNQSYFPRRVD